MKRQTLLSSIVRDLKSFARPNYARITPNLLHWKDGINPNEYGINLIYPKLPDEMHQEPFIIDFSDLVKTFGNADISSLNSFSVSRPVHKGREWTPLFYDHRSGFKDSWFGCYIIFDDSQNRGAQFILKDQHGSKSDLENICEHAMIRLTEIDQKVIFFLSHTGMKSYSIEKCFEEFTFDVVGDPLVSEILHSDNNKWKRVEAAANTVSAMPDLTTTRCGLLNSTRSFCALPSPQSTENLTPWHPITLRGELHARYVKNGDNSFWAITYYNGSQFQLKDGTMIDTWEDGTLKGIFRKAFNNLQFK